AVKQEEHAIDLDRVFNDVEPLKPESGVSHQLPEPIHGWRRRHEHKTPQRELRRIAVARDERRVQQIPYGIAREKDELIEFVPKRWGQAPPNHDDATVASSRPRAETS